MLDYVYGHDEIVARFVAQLIPSVRERGFSRCRAMGIVKDDGLIAGIVWHNYQPDAGTIEISGAALPHKYWLTRETLKRMYGYPFLELGCQMVVQHTPADNEKLLDILSRYDFMFVPMPRMFGREKDGVVCLLTVEDWAASRFNKRLGHHLQAMDQELAQAAE